MAAATGPGLSPIVVIEKPNAAADSEREEARWRPVLELPCQLTVDLPLPGFKLADFLKLQVGSVAGTQCRITQDVPLRINGTLIAWGEFEGSGQRLAVRLTELE
jgi:flagellar motor switch/type III secretory pathway protein FliN